MHIQRTPRLSSKAALFPNKIREYRLNAHLSQARLAHLLGHGRNVVSAWERGVRLPNTQSLFGLARELSTLTEHLYWGLYRPDYPEDGPRP